MTHKTIAIAGAMLLTTTSMLFAQGTTIVPAGQSGEAEYQTAQADGNAASNGSQQQPAAASDGQQQDGGGAEATASGGDAPAGEQQAESEAAPVSDGAQMAENEAMKPDAHPSKDTATEGNQVASVNPADADQNPGMALDPAGNPTYDISAEGSADWYTWRGYKKYMANCMQCHGPDGLGSSFAPNLTESLQTLNYYDYAGIIVSGQQNKWNPSGNSIMPAWGEDPNVMCSLDPIYVYLRGRADGVVARGEPKRPEKTEASAAAQKKEYDCLGF